VGIKEKIVDKKIKIGVIGLGYVGLPLAKEFAKAGVYTLGFDLDKNKIDLINKGVSYIPDVASEEVAKLSSRGLLRATNNFRHLGGIDVIFICVPTPFTKAKAPDISYIEVASRSIHQNLKKGQLIILQSTTYPGTTEEIVLPILEKNGFKAGKDFYLAFSPERIDPGNKKFTAKNTPKVVGGINAESTNLACAVFKIIIDKDKIFSVSGPKVAEMCKLLENTFRSVNIALVNELALLCDRMKINVWEVIRAAATKPFGYMPFYPGPGVGGHCIPVDPYYLSWKAREYDFYTNFIELAAEVNQGMPRYVYGKVFEGLNLQGKCLKGAKVLVLGAAFKPNIDDYRNSPSIEIMRLLREGGAQVVYNDPYVPKIFLDDEFASHFSGKKKRLASQPLTRELLKRVDCVLLTIRHLSYDYKFIAKHAKLVVDTVNGFANEDSAHRAKIIRL
jgi:UDP-N-acetyl-D-glucosamine dehydrogenase